MWVDYKVTGEIHDELNYYLNKFGDEMNLLKQIKENEIEKSKNLFDYKDYQIHKKINLEMKARVDELKDYISGKKSDHRGNSSGQDEWDSYFHDFDHGMSRDYKVQEIEDSKLLFDDQIAEEYIKIYQLIEARISDFKDQISTKGTFDYCGTSLKSIIHTLEIESVVINQNTDYKELDFILHSIDINYNHFKNDSIRSNRKIYILAITVFDNFLIDNIRLLYKKLSAFDNNVQKQKLTEFGNLALFNKVEWFKEELNPYLKHSYDNLVIYCALRNAIVHSSSIITEKTISYITKYLHNKDRNNFEVGMTLEIKDDEVLKLIDELTVLSKEIYDSVTHKFIMTFEERNHSFIEEIANIHLTEWD